MRAGVQQVFALDADLRAAERLAQRSARNRAAWGAGIVREQILQLGLKRGSCARRA